MSEDIGVYWDEGSEQYYIVFYDDIYWLRSDGTLSKTSHTLCGISEVSTLVYDSTGNYGDDTFWINENLRIPDVSTKAINMLDFDWTWNDMAGWLDGWSRHISYHKGKEWTA